MTYIADCLHEAAVFDLTLAAARLQAAVEGTPYVVFYSFAHHTYGSRPARAWSGYAGGRLAFEIMRVGRTT